MPANETTESMVLSGAETLELREFEVPDVSTEGALLEVEMTSVCGTDIGLYSGQEHFSNLPLIMGHEVVGRVVDGAEESLAKMGVEVGDRVMPEPYVPCYDCEYCQSGDYHMCEENRCFGVSISCSEPPHLWGGYGEYMYLPPNTRVHAVDESTPAKAACLGSVIGNGVRWVVEKGDVDPGDDVVIIGPGAQRTRRARTRSSSPASRRTAIGSTSARRSARRTPCSSTNRTPKSGSTTSPGVTARRSSW
jgi:threonine dehydrogenase-like Zn-dependent dehydrogenase